MRVLVVGDSHLMGAFGDTLEGRLRERYGGQIWMYGTCGGSPRTWSLGGPVTCSMYVREPGKPRRFDNEIKFSPPLSRLLAKINPEVTVLALGANMIRTPSIATPWMRPVVDEIRRAGGACVWLGPPPIRRYPREKVEHINELIRREAGDACPLAQSTDLTDYPRNFSDDVHYDDKTAARWADDVFERVRGLIDAPAPR